MTDTEHDETAEEPTFDAYRGEPDAKYGYTLANGDAREIEADSKGTVKPERAEDVAMLQSMGVPLDADVQKAEDAAKAKADAAAEARAAKKAADDAAKKGS